MSILKSEIKEVLVNSFKPKILVGLLKLSAFSCVVAAILAILDGGSVNLDNALNFLMIFGAIFVGFSVVYLIWVFIKVVAVIDNLYLLGNKKVEDAVATVAGKSVDLFWWILKGCFYLIALGVGLYILYFVVGGIIGLLKFGWKSM